MTTTPWFHPVTAFDAALRAAAATLPAFNYDFEPQVRPADPRFGDFQGNGVLPFAKRNKLNPRQLATDLVAALEASASLDPEWVTISIAGPGFINFTLTPGFLLAWMETYRGEDDLKAAAGDLYKDRQIVVDYSSPNTAKQMHVGHIRSTVIGEALARMLDFCGANVIRDNHIGDWGTQFGMLIYAIKSSGYDLEADHEDALADIEDLYKTGNDAYKEGGEKADAIRAELVKLQEADPENLAIWNRITEISWKAFDAIYEQLDVHFDTVLGESFYRDKIDRIYTELTEHGIAEESDGALVVFHPEHKRFAKQPFIVRKADGASNYATTDLATLLYRVEAQGAQEIFYVVDARQSDHFQQLFLTAEKWFKATGRTVPKMEHISFGTVLDAAGKPLRTKDGGTLKLKELLAEAIEREFAIVSEKNAEQPDDLRLSEEQRREIARVVGLGAVRYADLMQNRSSDYPFSWERMLSLEGNTAPYLLYAVARIHNIFRKGGLKPGDGEAAPSPLETEEEIALARKLAAFTAALQQAIADNRPHILCTYLYELAGMFSGFYNKNRVLDAEAGVKSRRFILCARTLKVLETGLHMLGMETLERM